MEPIIGIDFGTSNSSMAWYNPRSRQAEIIKNARGEERTPSVVYFGKEQILVGKSAENKLEDDEEYGRIITSIKRDLIKQASISFPDRPSITPVEVAAQILRKLKHDAETGLFQEPVERVVITHPAIFDALERDKLEEAAKKAGFKKVWLLPEPVAAAKAYAHAGLKMGQHLLVYDLGGGTFDLAVLTREEKTWRVAMRPTGDRCGGDDFDRALYNYCNEMAQQKLGRPISLTGEIDLYFLHQCRLRKENLSFQEGEQNFSSILLAPNGGRSVPFGHKVDRATFEGRIRHFIKQTVNLTKNTLNEAKRQGYPVDTVVLIGGSSRVPLIQEQLTQSLPVKPLEWEKRDVAVALGAAIHAHEILPPSVLTVLADGSGDYATLAEAINAVRDGGTIYVIGEHRLAEPLVISKSVRLKGVSKELTTIVCDAEEYVLRFRGKGCFSAVDITFQHIGMKWANVVVISGGEVEINQCRFTGAVQNNEGKRGGNGLYLFGNTNGQIRGCQMSANSNGIAVSGQAQPILEGNTCNENKQVGILYLEKAGGMARNNECSSNVNNGIQVSGKAQPILEGNLCNQNQQVGIFYFEKAAGMASNNECSSNVNSGIQVSGEAQPVLEGNLCNQNQQVGISYFEKATGMASNNECSSNSHHGIQVSGQAQPTLEGNRCNQNKQVGLIYFENAAGVAQNNECKSNSRHGIQVGSQAQPRLEKNECSKNRLSGIAVQEQSHPILQGNHCHENSQHGIFYGGSTKGRAQTNRCDGNRCNGIQVKSRAEPALEENECSKNRWSGIAVEEQSHPILRDNRCHSNSQNGIFYGGSTKGIAQANRCHGNGSNGIQVKYRAEPTLEGNICTENKEHGILIFDTAKPQLINNDLKDNDKDNQAERKASWYERWLG